MSSKVYFTSDLHFDHHSIVEWRAKLHNVDFISTQHMNEWIVETHNEIVRPKDIVWILGDISWSLEGLEHLDQMHGHKRLVLGNHDTEGRGLNISSFVPYFEQIHGAIRKYKMIMTHVPIHPNELEYRSWRANIHGHIHHKERCLDNDRYFNVNIDVTRGYPTSLEEIRGTIPTDILYGERE